MQGVAGMNEEEKFKVEVLTKLTRIETILEDFKGVETKATEAYNRSLDNKQRLDKIEDNNKWAFRTSIGAVITGLIGLVISLVTAVIK